MSSSLNRRLLPNLLPSSHVPPFPRRPNLSLRRSVASLPSSSRQRAFFTRATAAPTRTSRKMTFIRTFTAGSSRAASPQDEEGSKRANARKAAEIARDFRTDTITVPTDEMCAIMSRASRGDDVYGEDQATSDFEEKVARLAGKEAAMFAVSGTMTNQLAIRAHLTQPPHSIVLDSRAHIHQHEGGAAALLSQATSRTIKPENGHHITLDEVLDIIVEGDDIHTAPTKIVCLENTLSGMVFPQDEIVKISEAMHDHGILMHLDGARLWEVVAASGSSLEELCRPFDSVSLCMSKGLGAPVGSVLVGSKEIIQKAKWFRKAFGGGIRQSGGLAAGANYALDNHLSLLPRTHALAKQLANGLADLGVRLLLPVETNMLWIDPSPLGFTLDELALKARSLGLNMGASRFIVHHQITEDAVQDLLRAVKELKEEHKGRETCSSSAVVDERQNRAFAEGRWEGNVPHMSTRTTAYAARK
ncbi:pyridoxal phosphate-dependent transferase [Leucosporidium creatinivorum]|uniref:Pyridoxal phosphate-dependent transferase n=1 Tax=Leucosporidium creatinivorum TaxID=106004 RepID=A0A1Y2F2I7_9BASI|nr:pyridoxal phosphate-dependent transferase [Leucosporidium creatinivorum]